MVIPIGSSRPDRAPLCRVAPAPGRREANRRLGYGGDDRRSSPATPHVQWYRATARAQPGLPAVPMCALRYADFKECMRASRPAALKRRNQNSGCLLRVGTASSSRREAVTGVAFTVSGEPYGR